MEPWLAPGRDDLRVGYRAPGPADPRGEAVVVDGTGIVVLGTAGQPEYTVLLRYSDAGEVVGERRYPAALGAGRAIVALPDGYAVAGEVAAGELAYRAGLIRLDAAGSVVRHRVFGPAGVTGFDAVAVSADGSVVAAGTARGHGWLVRVADAGSPGDETEPADETELADDTELADVDGVSAVAVPAGGVVAATRSSTGRAGLVGFAEDRRIRWRVAWPGELTGVVALPDGGVAAVGHRRADGGGPARLWVVRVDAAGAVAWERESGTGEGEYRGRAVVAVGGDGVAVAGEVLRGTRRTVTLARLAADGTVAWQREYDGTYDLARGLAVTADGGLILAGSTAAGPTGGGALRVLRTDAGGTPVWQAFSGSAKVGA